MCLAYFSGDSQVLVATVHLWVRGRWVRTSRDGAVGEPGNLGRPVVAGGTCVQRAAARAVARGQVRGCLRGLVSGQLCCTEVPVLRTKASFLGAVAPGPAGLWTLRSYQPESVTLFSVSLSFKTL